MKTIPFFTDDIAIRPHTASAGQYLGRKVTLAEFSQGRAMRLYDVGNGELRAELHQGREQCPEFIEGPQP